jgi:hypothetical protein
MGLIPIQCRTNKLSRVDFEALEDEVKISTSNYK